MTRIYIVMQEQWGDNALTFLSKYKFTVAKHRHPTSISIKFGLKTIVDLLLWFGGSFEISLQIERWLHLGELLIQGNGGNGILTCIIKLIQETVPSWNRTGNRWIRETTLPLDHRGNHTTLLSFCNQPIIGTIPLSLVRFTSFLAETNRKRNRSWFLDLILNIEEGVYMHFF